VLYKNTRNEMKGFGFIDMVFKLTEDQERAVKLAKKWFYSSECFQRPFVIQGIAGSGKSSTVSSLIEALDLSMDEVTYAAFTGTAAVNLTRKNNPAITIHRLIYRPFVDKETHKVYFTLKERDELEKYKLIVIDEGGMLNKKLLEDLSSFGVPILVLGDKEQLKQFSGEDSGIMDKPDVVLTKPMRQALDSPILRLSYKIINGEQITLADSAPDNGLLVIDKNDIPDYYYINADQIICGLNKSVDKITSHIRHNLFQLTQPFPYENEKLICLKNNWNKSTIVDGLEMDLTNGLTGYALGFSDYDDRMKTFRVIFKPSCKQQSQAFSNPLKADVLYFTENIRNENQLYSEEFSAKYKRVLFRRSHSGSFEDINKFYFGYAETVYKSQGSEWDNVLYIDDPWGGKDLIRRQRYVAVTRSKQNLVVAI